MSKQSRHEKPARRMVYEDWMGNSDALMWHIERDPLLRSTVLGVWVLDRVLDRRGFAATLERTMRHVPRLRQRVVDDPLGVAPPRWEVDPHFDLSYHVRRVRAPGSGTIRDLLEMAAPWRCKPSTRIDRCGNCMTLRGCRKGAAASFSRSTTR